MQKNKSDILNHMPQSSISLKSKLRHLQFPLFVEKDEDGFYVVECPVFEGCYTQGNTLDEALKNIREVLTLIMDE